MNPTFLRQYHDLREIMTDHHLAGLGDAYVNFVYSLMLSRKNKTPSGAKLKGSILAEAVRSTGLRKKLPARMSSHDIADAAEALIVYAWLTRAIAINEMVSILEKKDEITDGLAGLLMAILEKARLS